MCLLGDLNFLLPNILLYGYFGRLGKVENARRHLFTCQQPDPGELQKLQAVEMHLMRCTDARKVGDWKSALMEGDAAIVAGADSSPQVNLQNQIS